MRRDLMRIRCRAAAVAALLGALGGVAADAQVPRSSAHAPAGAAPAGDSAARDSARIVADLRRAQAAFEARRRTLLPVSYAGGDRCDARIGRWCYWYDEQEPQVPAEPASIGRARDALLARLAAAAAAVPGDPSLVGQRVHYLVEAGRHADAVDAARACAAERAWCAALLGLALHRAGDAPGAERAFDSALAAMPADSACRWLDPRDLVPDDVRARLGAPCTPADSLVGRFWWLSTPFLSRRANERRNEHLARRVLARIFAPLRTPYADRWTADTEEMLVRYGWPDRWSRRERSPTTGAAIDAVGHEPWPAYRFTPGLAALLDARADAHPITDPEAHERAAPAFVRRVAALPLVAAAFRRGDSLRVVGVAPTPADSVRSRLDSLSLVVAWSDSAMVVSRVAIADSTVVGAVTAPLAPALVGMEAVDDTILAVRGRAGIAPPPLDRGFGVSDLLLHAASDDDPGAPPTLALAMRDALPADIGDRRAVGVYWELYGVGTAAGPVETTLRVDGDRPGWWSRAAARLRGDSPAAPPRVRWADVVPGGDVAPRGVTLDLGALEPGHYTVTLTARAPDGRTATAQRPFVVPDR